MGIISFFRSFFTNKEGKLFVLKELIAFLYLKYWNRGVKNRFDLYDVFSVTDVRKVNFLPPELEENIEYKRCDTVEKHTSDCLLFFGFNEHNQSIFTKISQLGDQAIVWLQLQLSEDDRYVLPLEKSWKIPKTGEDCFAGGGLRLRCLVPMRKWRVSYSGILKNVNPNSEENIFIKFSFIWTASSMPFDTISDIPLNLQSNYLAKQKWKGILPDLSKSIKMVDAYEQSGHWVGTVEMKGEESDTILLFGGRLRSAEPIEPDSSLKLSKDYFCYMQEGDYLHISEHHFANTIIPYYYGIVVHSNTIEYPLENVDIKQIETGEIRGEFMREDKTIEFSLSSPKFETEFAKADYANQNLVLKCTRMDMDKDIGNTFIIETSNSNIPRKTAKVSPSSNINNISKSMIIELSCQTCKNVHQTGGKGSSLAELTEISQNNNTFQVPKGVVVSISAYNEFLSGNKIEVILKENRLEETVYGKTQGLVQQVCEKIVAEISKTVLPVKVKTELQTKLEKIYKNDLENKLFAVRSSAAGEDSEDMSAAGQMVTFLGVKGLQQINESIVKCWASQFSYTAIQYKRQNGQILNSPMAVVVQEMVDAEQAGVMFTCDPLTGNPELINITANYGLGESVVSATAEPDTIIITRNVTGQVHLKSVEIGRKTTQTILKDHGGVLENEVSDSNAAVCCLPTDKALKLAEIGHKIEEHFGSPVDIEWAVKGNEIYLLQARPVTTFDKETQTEIIHETDCFLRCSDDCVSKANVGEVMPGATTEFGFQFIVRVLESTMQSHWTKKNPKAFPFNPYAQKAIVSFRKHVFFQIIDTLFRFEGEQTTQSAVTSAYQIALFGRTLDDMVLRNQGARRNRNYRKVPQKMAIFYMLRDMYYANAKLKEAVKAVNEYELIVDESLNASEYFEQTLGKVFEILKHGGCHGERTFYSTMISLALLTILSKGNDGKFDDKVYGDFATLVSSCEQVESADVPTTMKKLAVTISKAIEIEKFKNMKAEEALTWLQTIETPAKKEFEDFLIKHGHRCVKEFDVYIKPWGENPISLVKALQEMVQASATSEFKKVTMTTNETLDKLTIPLTFKRRMILKFFVPYCKSAVSKRETSKSVMIKIIDHFRKKFEIAAFKMAAEGYLPEKDLFYFLTIYEVSLLLRTRSPKLVQKAIRRKNMHPQLDAQQYDEIIKGLPSPINREIPPKLTYAEDGSLFLKGTPVSRGVVTGPVRVCTTLEEAAHIQPGDILLAYSTDIGWSPYFPMLSGVCTELGGLISHGAVVAREYGLPCVVGLHRATSMFKTGDIVLLDGNKGIIQRIEPIK